MKNKITNQTIALVMATVLVTTSIYGASSCTNEGADYTNCVKACKNCSTGSGLTGSCNCSKSDQLVYCDCNTGRNCSDTSVVASGHTCSASSSCPATAGACPATFPPDISTCPVVGNGTKQKESSTCSISITLQRAG